MFFLMAPLTQINPIRKKTSQGWGNPSCKVHNAEVNVWQFNWYYRQQAVGSETVQALLEVEKVVSQWLESCVSKNRWQYNYQSKKWYQKNWIKKKTRCRERRKNSPQK